MEWKLAGAAATVLVVDDDPDLLDLIAMMLEHAGYRVVTARHGGEALARVSEQMPDVILLDMKMPQMSGWEFARHYAASYPTGVRRAPVVVVTAADHAAGRAQEIAAEGYLAKPFTQAELLTEVGRRLPGPGSAATP